MLPGTTRSDYEQLVAGGEVIEKDRRGVKVMRLPGGRMLKLFRRRRFLSSQIWAPHARRFARNARALARRGIPTVRVEQAFRVPHLNRQAVLYQAVPGRTLRQVLDEESPEEQAEVLQRFGRFVSTLHDKGVLFRSLHLGNVIVDGSGDFALIDIVDMRFRWAGSLGPAARIRNFSHILRLEEDRRRLGAAGPHHFIDSYLASTQCRDPARTRMESALRQLTGS